MEQSTGTVLMNANREELWDSDITIAENQIKKWLAEYRNHGASRTDLENELTSRIENAEWGGTIRDAIEDQPRVLAALRALSRRDMGTAQFSDFVGIGKTRLERFEAGETVKNLPDDFTAKCDDLLSGELDEELVPWIFEGRAPERDEAERAAIVAADRQLRRSASTALRYAHEPRQLGHLSRYLTDLGYVEITGGGPVTDPRTGLPQGTFSYRRSIMGAMANGGELSQSVDVMIMPRGAQHGSLPVFMEAKSMTDKVNPNKRQKEEAQKAAGLRARWELPGEKLNFVLLLGGTVPRRYLTVERDCGLDWVWEHRIQDLGVLLASLGSH